MKNRLNDIIWGNRLFVNAQFVTKFVALLAEYKEGKCTMEKILEYVHALKKQKKVNLYRGLTIQLKEFTTLEELLKAGEATMEDVNVLNYVVNNAFGYFTKAETST